jgi:SNF2 family DNA or RNA helicase
LTTYSGMKSHTSALKPAAYQLVPLSKILNNGADAILISDGVGVGKTISAGYCILFLSHLLSRPSLVICPPLLVPKWVSELNGKFNITAIPVVAQEEFSTMETELASKTSKGTVTYIMPNSLASRVSFRRQPKFSAVVFDEIHTYRNRDTLWFKSMIRVSNLGHYRIGLSATPINNSLDDLVSILNILLPKFRWEAIFETFQDIWQDEKERITNSLVTRFTKENLGIHFAKRDVTNLTISYSDEYIRRAQHLIHEATTKHGGDTFFEKVTYYRIASSSPAALAKSLQNKEIALTQDNKMRRLFGILSERRKSRWIIFCEFLETAKYLQDEMTRLNYEVFTITGESPIFERESILEQFRRSRLGILILTSVGSEGIDLQFCDSMVNYDLHWNPMKIEQRIGRIDRVGQMKEKIKIVNFIITGSIDERILLVMQKKLGLVSNSIFSVGKIIDSESIPLFDREALETELKESNRFLEVLDYNSQISATDYEVLKHIDTSFCEPAKIVNPKNMKKETSWMKDSSYVRKWKSSIAEDCRRVMDIMKFYQ